MIIGVGIDVCPAERFAEAAERTASLIDKLFTADERVRPNGQARTPESLAARFAAKEALAKALGAPPGMAWHDAEVWVEPSGQPRFELRGTVRARADALGVRQLHLSLSHDGGMASAIVIAEG